MAVQSTKNVRQSELQVERECEFALAGKQRQRRARKMYGGKSRQIVTIAGVQESGQTSSAAESPRNSEVQEKTQQQATCIVGLADEEFQEFSGAYVDDCRGLMSHEECDRRWKLAHTVITVKHVAVASTKKQALFRRLMPKVWR